MKRIVFHLLFSFFLWGNLCPQSNINPDISLIGTFNTFTNLIKNTPEYGKLNFEEPSMELFVDGYLNPYAKATAVIAYEEGEFGVEELYGNIVRGLPLDIQIKAGKFLAGFGKLNTAHPHSWPFINRPLFHQVFFGEEGLNDIGINFGFLIPTGDIFTGLDIGIFRGDFINAPGDSLLNERGVSPVFISRLGSFFPLSDFTNIEVGLSASYGKYAGTVFPDETLRYTYAGFDFKYKYVPDSYTSLTIQGEALINYRDALRNNNVETISSHGGFVYADYKFLKQFSFGVKYDYTSGIVDDEPGIFTLNNDDKNSTQGIEGWFSFYPVEETSVLRLGVQHLMFNYDDNSSRDNETTITLQFLFSLGPHKAHPF